MVLGRLTRSRTQNVFGFDEMESFAAELAHEGQLRLVLVPQKPAADQNDG